MVIPSFDWNKNFQSSDDEDFWGLCKLYGDDSETVEVVPEEIKPEKLETSSFTKIFITAPLSGLFVYCGSEAARRLRMIDQSIQFTPHTFVLGMVINTAIIEAASGIHALALRCLGDRATYENLKDPTHATAVCHLRQKSWKVISLCEAVPRKIDVIYSMIFAVRTEQDIWSKFPDNQKYYRDGDPCFMEIVRRAFCEMLQDLFRNTVPFHLGFQGAALLGYPNPLSMILLKSIFNIIAGLIKNTVNAYEEIEKNENERAEIVRNFKYLEGLSKLESLKNSYTDSDDKLESLKDSYIDSDENEEVELEGLENYPGLILAII